MGISEPTAELIKHYEPLLQQVDVTLNNDAAEEVLFEIKIRETVEYLGGRSFGMHREHELRKLLVDNVRNGNIRSPKIIEWVKNQGAELKKTYSMMHKAIEEIFGFPVTLIDEDNKEQNKDGPRQTPSNPQP